MPNLTLKLEAARRQSWRTFGRQITFYLPGMFAYDGLAGRYPAASITGDRCALQCDHCRARILAPMIDTDSPGQLVDKCLKLEEKGNHGVLISGGCDENGRLPWQPFLAALAEVKQRTGLVVSVHSGLIDVVTAKALKNAGVDQALIDVIGDDETLQKIYHVPFGVERIKSSLAALREAGLPIVPHVVCGLNYGQIKGERAAIDMLAGYDVAQVVIVALMQIPGTPVYGSPRLRAAEVAAILAEARLKLPDARISLGCARQRGSHELEMLAIDAGVNRMAIPSDEAIAHAKNYGLDIRYQRTCCSVDQDFASPSW